MNKISKQLLKIAREVKALDEEGDGSGFQPYHDYENAEQTRLDLAQKEGKKYILHHKEGGLWRIMACKNFGYVKKGDFGGLIESEKNLSHKSDCWVYDNAKVYDNACVFDDACIYGTAKVYDKAKVGQQAHIFDRSQVYGEAMVLGGDVSVRAKVCGKAQVFGTVTGRSIVSDESVIGANATVCNRGYVSGKSLITNDAVVDYDVFNQEITK